jgi:hypothetical protein
VDLLQAKQTPSCVVSAEFIKGAEEEWKTHQQSAALKTSPPEQKEEQSKNTQM